MGLGESQERHKVAGPSWFIEARFQPRGEDREIQQGTTRKELVNILESVTKDFTHAEWVALLTKHGVPDEMSGEGQTKHVVKP